MEKKKTSSSHVSREDEYDKTRQEHSCIALCSKIMTMITISVKKRHPQKKNDCHVCIQNLTLSSSSLSLNQHTLREILQRSAILLAILYDDLLLIPTMPRIMICDQIMRELMAIGAEPAIEGPEFALFSLAAVAVQGDEPGEIEEETAVHVEGDGV